MSSIRKYVARLSDSDMRQILVDYEEFEQTAVTGDTVLRRHVAALMELHHATSMMQTWAQILVLEIWRFLAKLHDPTLGEV